VTWHWAHVASDCDPWAEPESQWHLDWKRYFEIAKGARVEVSMGPHRADVVLPSGLVIELQSSYLSAEKIWDREAFYGAELQWIYRAHWMDRVHETRRGLWWKNGSKAMTHHRYPVWWHMSGETDPFGRGPRLMMVKLSLVDHYEDGFTSERILGRIGRIREAPDLKNPQPPPPPTAPPPEQLSLLPAS
jgi:hypothetical protein